MTAARAALLVLLLAGCATSQQMRDLELQVGVMRAELARRDSLQLLELQRIAETQQRLVDSLLVARKALAAMRGDVANELYGIQQQLLQLQELTGQSQRRLSELRGQLDARGELLGSRPTTAAPAADSAARSAAPSASAQQMYDASLQQLRRGSAGTARAGLQELLRVHPQSELAPDALYFIGQSFAAEAPDSAAAYYRQVVDQHGTSSRAPAALYNLGLLAERRKDNAAAKEIYAQLTRSYPKADEAALARDRLRAIGR